MNQHSQKVSNDLNDKGKYFISNVDAKNTGYKEEKCSSIKKCTEIAESEQYRDCFFLFESSHDDFCIVGITVNQSRELDKEEEYWDELRRNLNRAIEEKNDGSIIAAKQKIAEALNQVENGELIEIIRPKSKKISYVRPEVIYEKKEKSETLKENEELLVEEDSYWKDLIKKAIKKDNNETIYTENKTGGGQQYTGNSNLITDNQIIMKPRTTLGKGNLTQTKRLKGKKYTLVQPKTRKEHWRSYKLDADDRKKSLYTNGKLDNDKLKKKFTEKISQIKIDLPIADGTITTFNDNWDKYIDTFNKNHNKPKWLYSEGKKPEDVHFDVSRQAQLFRYYAGSSLSIGFNPESQVGINAEIQASARLAEGRIGLHKYWPNKKGKKFTIGNVNNMLFLGYVRCELVFDLSGFAGASLIGSASIYFEKEKTIKAVAGLGGKIFAGIEIGIGVTGAIQWDNPEKSSINNERIWDNFVTVNYGVTGSLGVGIEGEIKVECINGKLIFRAKTSVVLGAGCGGLLSGTIDAKTIFSFIQFVYHKLKDTNFGYLIFIETEAFNYLTKLHLWSIEMGKDISKVLEEKFKQTEELIEDAEEYLEQLGKNLKDFYEEIDSWVNQRSTKREDAENLAERIIANPDIIKFTSPEVKGAMLHTLTYSFYLSTEERQEKAILYVLSWIQTFEEYIKVCNRVSKDGKKIVKNDKLPIKIPTYNEYTTIMHKYIKSKTIKIPKKYLEGSLATNKDEIIIEEDYVENTNDIETDITVFIENTERFKYTEEPSFTPIEIENNNYYDILIAKDQNLKISKGHNRIKKIMDGIQATLFDDFIRNLSTQSEKYNEGKLNNFPVEKNDVIKLIPKKIWEKLK